MAIKTVSLLDRFDNGNNSYGAFVIGGNLHLLSGETLTNKDTALNVPENWRTIDGKWTPTIETSSYWGALFEISKPKTFSKVGSLPESSNDSNIEYESLSITYQNLMENIVWDAKTYLNARHNLSNFDFLSVIHKDYTFTGNKIFTDNIYISGDTYLGNNIDDDEVIILSNVTNYGTLTQYGISKFISDAVFNAWAKIQNLSVHTSAVISCDIVGLHRDVVFDGWAYGLVDRNPSTGALTHNKTTVGTYDNSVPTELYNMDNRIGDPVCFYEGRPYELTAVNYAMSAYNLVDEETGIGWNVGNGKVENIGNQSDVKKDDLTAMYKAVYFKNGKPYATNIIDFANHAKWSDLGERYLADDVYEPGTLVKFGGEKEITIADDEVNAIVSTKAFDLNAGLVGGIVIALCGRVPTKVKGKIEKFDKIMLSNIPGIACKWDGVSRVIGRALDSNLDENVKLVECVTRFEI